MRVLKFIGMAAIFIGVMAFIIGLIITKGDFAKLKAAFIIDSQYEEVIQTGSEQINNVVIDVTTNNVKFFKSADESYRLEYYQAENDTFTFKVTDGTLSLINIYKYKFFNFGFKSKEINMVNVYLPNSFDGKINTSSTTGDITLSNFQLIELDINVTTGDIIISDCIITNGFNFDSTTGNVDITKVNAQSLRGNVTTGDVDINICNFTEYVIVDTTTGSITINQLQTEKINVNSTTGRVNIYLSGNEDDYQVDLSTSTGRINYQGTTTKGKLVTTKGAKVIEVHTTTGNITVDIN